MHRAIEGSVGDEDFTVAGIAALANLHACMQVDEVGCHHMDATIVAREMDTNIFFAQAAIASDAATNHTHLGTTRDAQPSAANAPHHATFQRSGVSNLLGQDAAAGANVISKKEQMVKQRPLDASKTGDDSRFW